MASGLPTDRKQLERLLARLERQYDKHTAAYGKYADEVRGIHELRAAGMIDDEHAETLHKGAKAQLDQTRDKLLDADRARQFEVDRQAATPIALAIVAGFALLGAMLMLMVIT